MRPNPENDPDKAKFLLRKAKAVATEVSLIAKSFPPYQPPTGELVEAMWSEAGFKVNYSIVGAAVRQKMLRSGDFHADSAAASYRFDPDGWFSRNILSTASSTKRTTRFRHARADELIHQARAIADKQKRLELYAEIDSIVNEELPILYIQSLTLLEAGVMNLAGYEPAITGAFSTSGAGIRTAWLR